MNTLIYHHAKAGLEKSLVSINKKIKRKSDMLQNVLDANIGTPRTRGKRRSDIASDCEERDRIEKALLELEEMKG